MSTSINPPRYPALEEALTRWGMVDPNPIAEPIPILTRLRRMQTLCNGAEPVQPARQPRFITDPTYWRKRAAEQGICLTCFGTGDLPEHDGHGGMEYIPCPACNVITGGDQPFDERPF